ncbi:hypothetical protein L3Q82_002995 [Scortum barcoo]|uniref:Uncharacterized protein n=1 Tax=Scortum barcoo TaxID=214431 RepID=A0ACB8VTW5_9TELE|nr:hypothetical protein L3Q82_002995 [Scortum barcoo]
MPSTPAKERKEKEEKEKMEEKEKVPVVAHGRGGGCGGSSERNLGMHVVLDATEGLRGRNVTCNNFFTSSELAARLLKRDMTMVGTVRKNKPELPPTLLASKDRQVFSSKFAFTPTTTVVSS